MAAELLGQRRRAAVHALGEQHDAFVFDVRADQLGDGLDLALVGEEGQQPAARRAR